MVKTLGLHNIIIGDYISYDETILPELLSLNYLFEIGSKYHSNLVAWTLTIQYSEMLKFFLFFKGQNFLKENIGSSGIFSLSK
jgi:hypothetical protein